VRRDHSSNHPKVGFSRFSLSQVNRELVGLRRFLSSVPRALKPGGRIAVLTFHSGEDRLVKKAFKKGLQDGVYAEVARDPLRPSKQVTGVMVAVGGGGGRTVIAFELAILGCSC
jgi:hypothetical protein